eukprot:scaffold16210_cov93-Skeletonema_dohrnii-CCMP3373.AAC.1
MQQQPPHMGRIPIPMLIKADKEAAGNELNAAIDAGCLGCTFVQPTNQPTSLPAPAIYHTVGVFVLMPRAGQSRAKKRTMQAQLPILQMTSTTQWKVDESIMIEAERQPIRPKRA